MGYDSILLLAHCSDQAAAGVIERKLFFLFNSNISGL